MATVMLVDSSEIETQIMRKALESSYSVIPMTNAKQAMGRLTKATVLPE